MMQQADQGSGRPGVVVAFGEPMLRYSVSPGERLWDARTLHVHGGGAELNVLVGMASLGEPVRYVTALPASPLGRLMRRLMDINGVPVVGDLAAPGRMGVYYYEPGTPPRPGVVTYDRQDSSFSRYPWSGFAWEEVLDPRGIFFTTGITAALGPEPLAGVRAAMEAAARKGTTIAFDVNYRAKLWSPDEARKALMPLMDRVDVLFTSVPDAHLVLGAPEMPPEELPGWLAERFHLQGVTLVHTPSHGDAVRAASGSATGPVQWRAVAWWQGERATWDQPTGLVTIDRLGAGDAYAAGFLWALRQGRSLADAVRYGSAMMALKNTVSGDFCPISRHELESLASDHPAGVQR